MERYEGVKFTYATKSTSFTYDQRLTTLNHWAVIFSELGLAPVHQSGAYGNQSYRVENSQFFITKSQMSPEEDLRVDNFVKILGYDASNLTFSTEGNSTPSSECFLHNALYDALPCVNAILHGHSTLLCTYAEEIGIPVTQQFCDYGTPMLAESAIELVDQNTDFFILKDHGFVALGKDIETAGKLTLNYYLKLIKLIQSS